MNRGEERDDRQRHGTQRGVFRATLLAFAAIITLAATTLQAQQTTDVAVTEVIVPPIEVPEGTQVGITFTIENLGAQPAQNFLCIAQIASVSAPSAPVFQESILVENIGPGQTQTLSTQTQWPAGPPGDYILSVAAAFGQDNNPNNNLLQQDLVVTPESGGGLLTLAEAIDILNEQVLDNHPRVDSLTALHLSPPQNEADSIIPNGLTITSADGDVSLQYENPVYLFFVDLHPDQLFAHPVEYVTVDATNGTVDRTTADFWPEIDGVTPTFGPDCFDDANPRRVRGNGQPCAEKANRYQTVATSNTGAWAVAVVGKLNKDVEKTTVDHDLCKWKERMNGSEFGPQVTGPNISTSSGTDGCGLTEKEFCDAIEALKGKECDKVHFKYIGHGEEDGVILWDNERKGSKKLTWGEIARKLKEAGVGEVCIEITACHAGGIIDSLKAEGIKGTAITSSSTGLPTLVGPGDGTWWEKALDSCSKDRNADLDRSGKIDLCELYAWVKLKGGRMANISNPQIAKLTSGTRITKVWVASVREGSSISTNQGAIKVRTELICWKSDSAGVKRTRYRGAVYLVNDNKNVERAANQSYNIVVRCNGRVITLVSGIQPRLKPGERRCIADLPDPAHRCGAAQAVRVRNGIEEKDDHIGVASAAPDDNYEYILTAATTEAGAFEHYRYRLFSDAADDDVWTFTATGPNGWNLRAEPPTFSMPESDTVDLYVGANVPAGAVAGGEVTARAINTTTSDTVDLIYNLHLVDTLDDSDVTNGSGSYLWYDVFGESSLGGTSDFDRTVFSVVDTLRLTDGTHDLEQVEIAAEEGGHIAAEIASATLRLRQVGMNNSHNGLKLSGGRLDLETFAITNSQGSGLHLDGDAGLTVDTLRSLTVIDGNGTGLILENFSSPVRAQNLVVDNPGIGDIRLTFASLDCIDCEYDQSRTLVGAGSVLRRYATLNAVVVDSSENPLPGISVRVVSDDGIELFSGLTDADGFLPVLEMLVSTNDAGNLTEHGPYYVTVRTDQVTIIDTIDATGWTGRIYTLPSDVTSVDVAATTGAAIGVRPMPTSAGSSITIETGLLREGAATAELFGADGSAIGLYEITIGSESTASLLLPDNLANGIYLLRLVDARGAEGTTRLVVRN